MLAFFRVLIAATLLVGMLNTLLGCLVSHDPVVPVVTTVWLVIGYKRVFGTSQLQAPNMRLAFKAVVMAVCWPLVSIRWTRKQVLPAHKRPDGGR